jgi:SAM-dependent methyltransferase
MLTVDFSRLSIQPGTRLLDLGSGAGRHAFEAARRGAEVVALDLDPGELKHVAATAAAMAEAGELQVPATIITSVGDATKMPFPDDTFDIVIAAEVMEHIPADQAAISEVTRVLRPGGVVAVTVPAWLPERICWLLSDDYHNVRGGHIRIFTRYELETKLARAGLTVGGHHHAHALHSPYWWLKCAVGVHDDSNPLATAYHKLLVWDIMRKPAVTQFADRALNPLIGKSLVVYASKPAARAAEPRPVAAEKVHAAA